MGPLLNACLSFLAGGLLTGFMILFACYVIGSSYHWAPGDPEPSLKNFIKELMEFIKNRVYGCENYP